MKVLVVFLLFVAYSKVTSEPESNLRRSLQVQKECLQENGWGINELDEMPKKELLPVGDERLNDLILCIWKRLGLIDENGVFDVSQLKVLLSEAIQVIYNTSKDEAVELIDQALNDCSERIFDKNESFGQKCVLLRNCIVQYVNERQK